MGERQKFFQNLVDELKAMDQIEELKVPSDGGFMANYNDRNKFSENKTKEMKEDRVIDRDERIINLKEKTEIKKKE